jgi:hypothetical protein
MSSPIPMLRHRGCVPTVLRCSVSALTLLVACAADDPAAEVAPPATGAGAELLAPPARGSGVQYKMVTELAPGEESEHCLFVVAPAETTFVQRDEIRFTAGSHHVLLYETAYDTIPTAKEDGTPVDTGGVFDCSDGATNGWNVTKLIGGSQNGTGKSLLSFPEGVAMRMRGSAVLMINAHYINPNEEPVRPEVRINLHSVREEDVREEGDLLFLYNPLITVSAGETGRARMRCPVHRDITLSNVQSHMHRRGIGYAAMVEGEAPFYENDHWEDVAVKEFGEGFKVAAGQRFDYYCDYENSADHDIFQGPRSTDEMCMLIGAYYPADRATSNCRDASDTARAMEWVGNGEATCAETFACISSAAEGLPALARCMDRADPALAAVTSEMLRCVTNSEHAEEECASEVAACLGT